MNIDEKKLKLILTLLDNHIVKELKKDDINEDRIAVITDIRSGFIKELYNLNRGKNIRKMYDKEYWKRYQKSIHY
jgi:hypothetical protein